MTATTGEDKKFLEAMSSSVHPFIYFQFPSTNVVRPSICHVWSLFSDGVLGLCPFVGKTDGAPMIETPVICGFSVAVDSYPSNHNRTNFFSSKLLRACQMQV